MKCLIGWMMGHNRALFGCGVPLVTDESPSACPRKIARLTGQIPSRFAGESHGRQLDVASRSPGKLTDYAPRETGKTADFLANLND